MPHDERLARRVRHALAPEPGVTEEAMFGGLAFLREGRMFCGIVGERLMVRVGAERHAELLALPHVAPMDFTGRPMKGYVYVAAAGCRTARQVTPWMKRALAVLDAPRARPTKRAAPTGRRGKAVPATDPASPRGRTSPRAGRSPSKAPATDERAEVFATLRALVARHRGPLTLRTDTPAGYVLTGPPPPGTKRELWVGGVRLGKRAVSLHLMPVYQFPELLHGLSPALRARLQGKSCFNFNRVDPALMAEVEGLIARSMQRLGREGLLPARAATPPPGTARRRAARS